jgi:hypothetical protein
VTNTESYLEGPPRADQVPGSAAQHFRYCTGVSAKLRITRGSLTLSTESYSASNGASSDSRRRTLLMRYARILSIGLVATVAFAWSAAAVENAHELAGYCQSLERGAKGAGRHIYIPRTREALSCWGYMQGMQDLSALADETGARLWAPVRRSR